MDRETLSRLSKDDLIDLLLAQHASVAVLTTRIAALEAKFGAPAKTPDNSSLPPSKGQKRDLPARAGLPRRGRPGTARALAEHPDHTIEAMLDACPHCDQALSPADQPDVHAYDHIDLPPIRPITTRINRHHGTCPCCRKRIGAAAPAGMEPRSPFGPTITALILHLHITQAVSFERLVQVMQEVFGLTISEGAIANMLARAEMPLIEAAEIIAATVRASPVVGSDETSARVCGQTWWQWVLLSTTAIYHVIAPTRGAMVARAVMGEAKPDIWVADRWAGQLGHGAARQMCLAHLLRDAQCAVEEGDLPFAPGFRRLLLRAMAVGRRRQLLTDAELARYHRVLEARLDRLLLGKPPARPAARKLFRAMVRHRDDLFRFMTRRDVPTTNNACERALRPSVIFRKVTNGFRAKWSACAYAAAASVIATGRLHGYSALESLRRALERQPVLIPA